MYKLETVVACGEIHYEITYENEYGRRTIEETFLPNEYGKALAKLRHLNSN